ncbi:MAG: LPS assembly protein LptD, partial [Nitrospirota bacterium]|nr:LPS assembly protein LptD [Nitrospirota bacterium]
HEIMTRHTLLYLSIITSLILFAVSPASAEEPVNISADKMEYLPDTSSYSAKGSAKIILGDSTLLADEMLVSEITSDAVAAGNVIYESPEAVIQAERMDLNLRSKLGTIRNGYIYYKTNNYHIRAGNIRKLGETTFYLDSAAVTTCDADPPAWKITGRDITIKQHESLTARDTKFYIKNAPVLYTPYYWMPLIKKRQAGLLFPSLGFSSERGNYYKQGFFWPFKDNQDMTLYLDYYSEKGLAEGLDYRYVLTPGSSGEFWMYHVRDREPDRDLYEFKSYHNLELPGNVSSYLKLHLVNESDYYEVMESTSSRRIGFESIASSPSDLAAEDRYLKYLESNLQISRPFSGGRTYMLGQYRQSIEGGSGEIPQVLPEAGLILNTRSERPFSFNLAVKGSNFVRKEGQEGQRMDISSNFYLSYGRMLNITQRVGLRETEYVLKDPDTRKSRQFFDYDAALTTKFLKKYSSFIHIIEPSIEYAYIPEPEYDYLPVFDSLDSYTQQSNIVYSLTNELRGFALSTLNAKLRLSQSYDLLVDAEPFSPVLAESSVSSNIIDLSLNASYDVYKEYITDTIASVTLKGKRGYIGTGRNWRHDSTLDQMTYLAGLYSPITMGETSVPVSLQAQSWHNLITHETEQINLRTAYTHQCWGFSLNYTKKPDEYQILFAIELTGLGSMASESFTKRTGSP